MKKLEVEKKINKLNKKIKRLIKVKEVLPKVLNVDFVVNFGWAGILGCFGIFIFTTNIVLLIIYLSSLLALIGTLSVCASVINDDKWLLSKIKKAEEELKLLNAELNNENEKSDDLIKQMEQPNEEEKKDRLFTKLFNKNKLKNKKLIKIKQKENDEKEEIQDELNNTINV